MYDFLKTIIAMLFGGTTVKVQPSKPSQSIGYFEGDDSPWLMGDEGPINGRM